MSKLNNNIQNSDSHDGFDELLGITSKLKVPPSAKGKEFAWDKLIQSIEQSGIKKRKTMSFSAHKIWYSIAASFLVLLTVASLTYRFKKVECQTLKGEMANILLPDGSEIKLNTDSKVEYRRFGWLSDREVKLKGEAFFSVKQGNRFTVLAEFNRKITVTGTKFNVFARGAQFEVKCFEGSVKVETPSIQSVSLAKGNLLSIDNTDFAQKQFLLDSIAEPKWIMGEFYFNNTPLNQVFDEFGRQLNIKIKVEGVNVETRNYTGFFKRNSLKQALDLVCIPMGLSYHINSDSTLVTIKKE